MTDYVAYYRVSTDKQGKNGLGLDAQHQAVAGFVAGRGTTSAESPASVQLGRAAGTGSDIRHCDSNRITLCVHDHCLHRERVQVNS